MAVGRTLADCKAEIDSNRATIDYFLNKQTEKVSETKIELCTMEQNGHSKVLVDEKKTDLQSAMSVMENFENELAIIDLLLSGYSPTNFL